jgi:glycosyltransferase involved in cell wall biosynthesis
MRVALIDNMNNNFFVLARYLRDLGLDAHLFIIPGSEHKHFLPQEDTFFDLSEVDWIHTLAVSYNFQDFIFCKAKLRSQLLNFDQIIACGLSLSYLSFSGIKVNLFIPYGADLYLLPFREKKLSFNLKKLFSNLILSFQTYHQVRAIRNSDEIICNTNWRIANEALNKLNVSAINLPRLMVYQEKFENKESKLAENYWSFLRDYDFVVFSPTRHLWKSNSDPLSDFNKFGGMKRNDKLINAFSKIVKQCVFKNPILILFEYGADVSYSKDLISRLGIFEKVIWVPLMSRKYIMKGMTFASIVADQFREGMSATSAGTTNEALAVGVPVVANTDGAIFDICDPYCCAPIIQALDENEIYQVFLEFANNRDKYMKIAKKSALWFSSNLGKNLAVKYAEIIKNNLK